MHAKNISILSALMAIGLALTGCDSKTSESNFIVIATAGPMTGQYATFGEQMRRGAEQAVKDINAAGGVLGKKLKLEIGDDQCDPKQAVAVANQMVNKGVKFMAGHFCSGSSIPASQVYQTENILMISPGSTNPKLTERGMSNVFRVCGRDDQQGQVAGDFIADKFKGKRIAVVHDKQAYSQGLAEETMKQLKKRGVSLAMTGTVTPKEKDYSAIVTRLKKNRIDILFYGGYHAEAGLIVRQMREQGLTTRLVSGDALVTQEFWNITGKLGEGTLMTFSPDPRKNPKVAPLVAKFKAQGFSAEGYTLYTYAAIQVFAQAAERAGGTDAAKLREQLHGSKFDTVLGTIGFDAKGDVTAPGYVFYEWKDGTYDYVTF
ncbi:MAG: branched-chain amino acid ABC transporter substrate-binding protein [Alphaproteobacteria bacterium]|nr:branched-chain amino acid ABC transporter substrate-binding protein [Alphaproteobacteria bacterium]MCZ6496046.1 branched-chain amino acid ABC transporter substrate-binding protein [Alphaproteobacteria bacterium]MCZ6610923.1 branched-chain amino acid ABC transporter substrate-binding protein [Alphaproteobacteria bacterium]MCZ6742335.1 branched-chain amino acid ABC transporter substrate-binding protein [Alphaproteobacteria bacterium]MCZ6813279.1 branched-chain amino acid ABC transporter substr